MYSNAARAHPRLLPSLLSHEGKPGGVLKHTLAPARHPATDLKYQISLL